MIKKTETILYEISQLKEKVYIDLLRKLEIKNLMPVHINILLTINEIKTKPFIVNIAKELYKSKADTSAVIATLVKKDYIAYTKYEQDKRAKLITLTTKGQEVLTKTEAIKKEINKILITNLNVDEQKDFITYLLKSKQNLIKALN